MQIVFVRAAALFQIARTHLLVKRRGIIARQINPGMRSVVLWHNTHPEAE